MLRTVLAFAVLLALAACDYGQSRSSFQLKVAGKTLEEAREAAGKPEVRPALDAGANLLFVSSSIARKCDGLNARGCKPRGRFS
jgi:hypothetical protein